MDKAPTLSAKERIVLELLISKAGMYGLEMVKASNGKLKRGTIYVMLTRMTEKGFVKSKQDKEPNLAGMPRRKYFITGTGQSILLAERARENVFAGNGAWA